MTKELFNKITAWQKEVFPDATAMSKLIHLAGENPDPKSEIAELMADIESESVHAYEEFADCFFLLFGAAAAIGLGYDAICADIENKFNINKKRTWGKPDKNGVVNHKAPMTEIKTNGHTIIVVPVPEEKIK